MAAESSKFLGYAVIQPAAGALSSKFVGYSVITTVGAQSSKFLGYAVTQPTRGALASKFVGYAVIGTPPNVTLNISESAFVQDYVNPRTRVFLFTTCGDFEFTVPPGVFVLNLVQGIGGGMAGTGEQTVAFTGRSGGGGGYAENVAVPVTPGQVIRGHVGCGQAGLPPGGGQQLGDDTWFGSDTYGDPSCIMIAKGACYFGLPQTGNFGSTTYAAPSGVLEAFEFGPGAGGSGASGPYGSGAPGLAPGFGSSTPVGTILGGQGGNGHGGQGGTYQIPPNYPAEQGGFGREIDGYVGSGGGGGTAVNNLPTGGNGGDGGLYGGGGGTGEAVGGYLGGAGAQGMLRIVVISFPFAPPGLGVGGRRRQASERVYPVRTHGDQEKWPSSSAVFSYSYEPTPLARSQRQLQLPAQPPRPKVEARAPLPTPLTTHRRKARVAIVQWPTGYEAGPEVIYGRITTDGTARVTTYSVLRIMPG